MLNEQERAAALMEAVAEGEARHTIDVSGRELATILAALRQRQSYSEAGGRDWCQSIATDGGQFNPLDAEEIDELCERINGGT